MEKQFSMAENILFGLYFGAYETTSSTTTVALKFLRDHPQVLAQLKGKEMHTASKNFLAFGGGRRTCCGADFAKLQMAIFIHYMVTQYSWKITKERSIVRKPGLAFPKPLCIQLTKNI